MSHSRSSEKCVDVPHNLTAFWKPVLTGDPLTTGSLGAGVVITPYATACFQRADEPLRVFFNGREARHETLAKAVELLAGGREVKGRLFVEEPLPISAGYATSASIVVSSLLAMSEFLGKTELEAFQAAHVAEVLASTGLGDVLSIFEGAEVAVRVKPGAPGVGEVVRVRVPPDTVIVSCALGSMPTREMLGKNFNLLEEVGGEIFGRFLRQMDYYAFLELAREFSAKIGFLPAELSSLVDHLARECHGYYAKKKVLAILCNENSYRQVAKKLAESGACVLGVHVHYPVRKISTWSR